MGGYASIINSLKELEQKGVNGKDISISILEFYTARSAQASTQIKKYRIENINTDNFHSKGTHLKREIILL